LSQIEKNCRQATYNRGHEVIAQMEQRFPRVWTLTQNIDGFHAKAGSKNLIEIHGNMHRLRCDSCGWKKEIRDFSEIQIPPICQKCQEMARPDVVFFGEMLPSYECVVLQKELREAFDIYVWVGTTAAFPYIQEPLYHAHRIGALSVEINPGETEISCEVDYKIAMNGAKALETLWQSL
jgi:NAD-dependent deacetylase